VVRGVGCDNEVNGNDDDNDDNSPGSGAGLGAVMTAEARRTRAAASAEIVLPLRIQGHFFLKRGFNFKALVAHLDRVV